jgi:hypothetical protein
LLRSADDTFGQSALRLIAYSFRAPLSVVIAREGLTFAKLAQQMQAP